MNIENNYPKINKKLNKFFIIKNIILLIFLISIISCTIVNLCVGGKRWMLYVIISEIIFYYAFLNRPCLDKSLIKRITIVLFWVCVLLFIIDLIEKSKFSYFVITIIYFSTLIIQFIFFLSAIKFQRRKVIPMFYTLIIGIILFVLPFFCNIKLRWASIVLGSLDLLIIIILLTIFHKDIFLELKKYYSIK